jgi:hypothetical protein
MKKTAAVGTRLGVLIRQNKLRPNFDPGAFLNLYKIAPAVGTRLGVLIRHNKLRPNFDPGAFLNLYKIAHSETMWNNTASGFEFC